jgi:predicted HTH transcriptional regulator
VLLLQSDAKLIEKLLRFSRGEGFDEQPPPGLSSEAIDFRAASESFAALRALRSRDLESLRLVGYHQGKTVPNVGGMILSGHDREQCAAPTAGACRPRPCARP